MSKSMLLHLINITFILALTLSPLPCAGQTRQKPKEAQTGRDRPITAAEINKYFGESDYPLRMTIKPTKRAFSRDEPFMFDVTFTNTAKVPVFINLISSFGFQGYLEDFKKDILYRSMFGMDFLPKGSYGRSVREHYKEIPVGKSHTLRASSTSVHQLGTVEFPLLKIKKLPWKERKPGRLKFHLNYYSGNKTTFFPGEFEGIIVSNTVVIYVR